MKPAEFEREVLIALRDPAFSKQWAGKIPPILSQHGLRVANAMLAAHRHRGKASDLLTASDVAAVLKKEGTVPESVRTLAREVCANGKGPHPQLTAGLADEILRLAALDALVARALAQRQTGNVNLDELVRTLRSYRRGGETIREFDPAALAAETNRLKPLPTPWKAINAEIEGGLRPKELAMVLATPKVGKTSMLLNLAAEALAQGWAVLYLTAADLGYTDLGGRLAGVWLDKPSFEVRRDKKLMAEAKNLWEAKGGRLLIADYAARACTMPDIERAIEDAQEAAGEKPLAVILDRLEQAVAPASTGDQRRDITANFEESRRLAQRYAVPIWCDSQAALMNGDEGWVYITRGSEARIGKAKTVDLSLGVGVHPENEHVLRVVVEGRREIRERCHELHRDPRSGVIWE